MHKGLLVRLKRRLLVRYDRVEGAARRYPVETLAAELDPVDEEVQPVGLHINDSVGGDDHLPPGEGKVDFAALRPMAEKARHLVFEPHSEVSEESLAAGLVRIKACWCGDVATCPL